MVLCDVEYTEWLLPALWILHLNVFWFGPLRGGVILEWYLFCDRVWGLRIKTRCPWICCLPTFSPLNIHLLEIILHGSLAANTGPVHGEAPCDVATTKSPLLQQRNRKMLFYSCIIRLRAVVCCVRRVWLTIRMTDDIRAPQSEVKVSRSLSHSRLFLNKWLSMCLFFR